MAPMYVMALVPEVGRCTTVTPPDPYTFVAERKAPGTQVVSTLAPIKWKPGLQNAPFTCNFMHRYTEECGAAARALEAAPRWGSGR
jgi:hypothetical protein